MKIVVLDGYTLNPGDLSWLGLENLGTLEIYKRTLKDEIVERANDADILLVNKVPLQSNTLKEMPKLKYIGVLATGYDIIDTKYTNQQGIVVTNVPEYGASSVAQMTFALILELCMNVQKHNDSVKKGKWSRSLDFCYWDFPLIELLGKTIGIIGFGAIGQQVGTIASAFGMKILGHSRTQIPQGARKNFNWENLDQLLRESDILSIHCPLNSSTKGLVNTSFLRKMKESAFLINTSRGAIINEEDLALALEKGWIAGAALDVLSTEPPYSDNPLFKAENCIITPHIAWATREARQRLMNTAVNNLKEYLLGHPINRVG